MINAIDTPSNFSSSKISKCLQTWQHSR